MLQLRAAKQRSEFVLCKCVAAVFLLSWRPFIDILEESSSDSSYLETSVPATCAVRRLRELLSMLRRSGMLKVGSDISCFMMWIFSRPNVSLRENIIEDPHNFVSPLWQMMTMAGGSCFEFCGENCINESVHMKSE